MLLYLAQALCGLCLEVAAKLCSQSQWRSRVSSGKVVLGTTGFGRKVQGR